MRESAAEYDRYLAVNPRDHAWGLCVTGAGRGRRAEAAASTGQLLCLGCRAAEMLHDSPMPVKQIAMTLGFRNPYHFSKLFTLKTGSSPRDYRQHWRSVSAREAATTS
jgi:hypothetical protein